MIRSHEGALHLGPADAGVELTDDEFERADFEPGHRYELVAGRLAVSPAPEKPHDDVATWLQERLWLYSREQPGRIQRLTARARIITRALGATTDVEPDLAAFAEYPLGGRWTDVSPFLVVEVLSPDPQKDLVRNREIYWRVPSIQEYWIVDDLPEDGHPSMIALTRGPTDWIERHVPAGGTYRTDLLPGFELDLSKVS